MFRMSRTTSPAFTIPELLITITVGGIILGLIFGPLNDLYDSNTKGVRSIIQAKDVRGALRQIENEISLSTGFLAQDNKDDVGSTVWNWRGVGPTYNDPTKRVLITENYGTANIGGTARMVVTNSNCDTTQKINYVYYVKNSSLYRRTLKNFSYPATCDGVTISQKRTCANMTDSPRCEGLDAKIVEGVSYFSVDYYAYPYSETPLDNTTASGTETNKTQYNNIPSNANPPNNPWPATARTVVITITITTGAGNNTVPMTSKMRITRMNGNI